MLGCYVQNVNRFFDPSSHLAENSLRCRQPQPQPRIERSTAECNSRALLLETTHSGISIQIAVKYATSIWNFLRYGKFKPIPVAARSKEWVCGHSLDGIEISISARSMDVCLVDVACRQVKVSASGWLTSRGVPTIECGMPETAALTHQGCCGMEMTER